VLALAQLAWPWVSAAQDVWETTLVNYDAIDHVATLLCNLGSAEGRMGRMLLWGEGATPGVVNAIEAVDAELLALRDALGIGNRRRYINYIKDQGFVDEVKSSLYETIQASKLVLSPFVCGPRALESRYVTEDVPCALVLASSIGVELGVGTPLIDGLIALASAVTKTDWRVAGRSLAQWDLAGTGREGLKNAAEHGWW
jgi:opine dehydrogenase